MAMLIAVLQQAANLGGEHGPAGRRAGFGTAWSGRGGSRAGTVQGHYDSGVWRMAEGEARVGSSGLATCQGGQPADGPPASVSVARPSSQANSSRRPAGEAGRSVLEGRG
jgi:hypothetical protein